MAEFKQKLKNLLDAKVSINFISIVYYIYLVNFIIRPFIFYVQSEQSIIWLHIQIM